MTIYTKVEIRFRNGLKIFAVDTYSKEKLKFKVRSIKPISCEDWKTNLVKPKPDIPIDTILECTHMTNCYGRYLETIFNEKHYYINPGKVEFLEELSTALKI